MARQFFVLRVVVEAGWQLSRRCWSVSSRDAASRCVTIKVLIHSTTARRKNMNTNKKVTYLVSIFIGTPTQKHAQIKDIAAQVSGDDYEFLHLHQMGAFLVLNTDRNAKELAGSFSRATAADDRVFICEMGQDWHALGLNKAMFWLQNHLATKTQTPATKKGNPFGDA